MAFMNNKLILMACLILHTALVFGNTEESLGGVSIENVHPFEAENIEIEYERIIITQGSMELRIDIFLELNNLDLEAQRSKIGFELKSFEAYGSFDIEDFQPLLLRCNNEALEYSYIEDEKSCTIFYEPLFTPGQNTLYLTYSIPFYISYTPRYFEYLLKSGTLWKGGLIKDLEIIYICDEAYIYPYEDSLKGIEIRGLGKILPQGNIINNGSYYSFNHGFLYWNQKNFSSDQDIRLVFQEAHPSRFPSSSRKLKAFLDENILVKFLPLTKLFEHFAYGQVFDEYIRSLSIENLRIVKNMIYAKHGYVFDDPLLQEYFESLPWYFGNPNIKKEDQPMTSREKALIQFFIEIEALAGSNTQSE